MRMTMAVVWIAPMTLGSTLDCELVAQLLHRYATHADGLQHARVRRGTDNQLMIFGFLMAETRQQAHTALLHLTQHTLTAEPALRLWRII